MDYSMTINNNLKKLVLFLIGLVFLIWWFWYFNNNIFILFTFLICFIIFVFFINDYRQKNNYKIKKNRNKNSSINILFPHYYRGAIIIICGQSQSLFQKQQTYRETHKGRYLYAHSPDDLLQLIQTFIKSVPSQLNQLSLLYVLIPEQISDLNNLTQEILNWHRAFNQCNKAIRIKLPIWITIYINPPMIEPYINKIIEIPCLTYSVIEQKFFIKTQNTIQSLAIWLAQNNYKTEHQFAITLWLNQLIDWIKQEFSPQLMTSLLNSPNLTPSHWAIQFATVHPMANSIWEQFIYRKTALSAQPSLKINEQKLLPLPDTLINKNNLNENVSKTELKFGIIGIVSFVFILSLFVASYYHNKQLIYRIGNHINQFNTISVTNLGSKNNAYQQLKLDAELLSYWQRKSPPFNYLLGFYQGNTILPYLQTLLRSPLPIHPPTKIIKPEQAQQVILNSLSLFNSGQYQLRKDATKVLTDMLINIKAKSGWLIVISGHTDNTGDPKFNQQLSLKRAESVRNWIVKTTDISSSCFKIQGFGQYHPIADNLTLDGRARNRRVEIQLIPQANACQGSANTPTPLINSSN